MPILAKIADLGKNVVLEDVSAHLALNMRNVHSFDVYTKFALNVSVQPNHSYAVVLNKNEVRGLFVFTVTDYVPNKKVALRYVIKSYQVTHIIDQSPRFNWERKNSR